MLSRDDVMEAITEGKLKIYPFEKKNLTGIGYNLSTAHFAFSINRGILLTIHQQTTQQGVKRYVMIPPNDTVLLFSKEYIEIDRSLAGTLHSKVARGCQGFGNISTTLDPTWKGQLIISLNNPMSDEIKFDLDMNSGNIMTLLLHKLDQNVTGEYVHDNNQGRCDLLLEHFAKPSSNKKYKDKHFQLEKFVVGDFAYSLNGYDQFINTEYPEDKYTQKIEKLTLLLERLADDKTNIREKRYSLGNQGNYYYLKNIEETELIRSCCLFQIEEQIKKAPDLMASVDKANLDDENTIKMIDIYRNIINYELETINHIRRVKWQNDKIDQFAGEESEFVYLRRRNDRKVRFKYACSLFFFILFLSIGMYALCQLNLSNDNKILLATICAPAMALLFQWWRDWCKKHLLDKK